MRESFFSSFKTEPFDFLSTFKSMIHVWGKKYRIAEDILKAHNEV